MSRTVCPEPSTAPFGIAALAVLGRIWAPLAHAARRKQTIDALYRLNDRQLADIGLSRDGIEASVRAQLDGGEV